MAWLQVAGAVYLPKMIIVFSEGKDLSTERNVIGKQFRKEIGRWGYQTKYWTMGAWRHGVALNQIWLVTILTLGTIEESKLEPPDIINLPVQSMGNLLMPMGVPYKAKNKRPVQCLTQTKVQGPKLIGGYIDGHEVYQIEGAMPDRVECWIEHPSGIRRLQHQELAKAKGFLDTYEIPTNPGGFESVRKGTCVHLMKAVLDHISQWHQREPEGSLRMEPDAKAASIAEPIQALWNTGEEDVQLNSKWDWEPPDLTEGSEWYNSRVASLNKAVQGLDEMVHWLKGLQCLDRHRLNYTEQGPQQLQLLWWEFPCEHWKALREGCPLGFLVSPEGELVLNGSFTHEERQVAGRFVDELKALGSWSQRLES
jgi:hypothetical protein